ncbi:hypothetical protein KTAU_15370 [Thermogemmatispora aurantia]|uniref:Uncharacterized protein n=1 Tax=Thermogemmatispora aurantia TaxID=2045279 RepID=A0A5J4K889_9CHLR|nr:hypothetical protein KTAU_15370 [Thermogemmatispora aurantia]
MEDMVGDVESQDWAARKAVESGAQGIGKSTNHEGKLLLGGGVSGLGLLLRRRKEQDNKHRG